MRWRLTDGIRMAIKRIGIVFDLGITVEGNVRMGRGIAFLWKWGT